MHRKRKLCIKLTVQWMMMKIFYDVAAVADVFSF